MATKRSNENLEKVVGQALDVIDVAAAGAITQLKERIALLDQDNHALRKKMEADAAAHNDEVLRLDALADNLQAQLRDARRGNHTLTLDTPENCLAVVIGQLQAVAVGGAASVLRQTVNAVGRGLGREDRAKLKEYMTRLRGAAEAAEQEAGTLLL